MTFQKILCPIDFSEDSQQALQVAAETARASRAMLVLLYVWQPQQWMTDYGMQWPNEVLLEAQALEEGKLATYRTDAQRLGAPEVVTKLLRGEPWDQIVSVAREDPGIDLIVMGTHGRTGLRRALIGSVAERVVRHAPCTVMVVRAPQAKQPA
ncbi:MAG: universal stress protein [Deltaproteobacteria bacterium]|nr:MAG: universal stress protein [Deltaproteobacteria bacterium]